MTVINFCLIYNQIKSVVTSVHVVVMPRSSDKTPRVRRTKTREEKRKLHNKKNKDGSEGVTALTKFFLLTPQDNAPSGNADRADPTPVNGTKPTDKEGSLVRGDKHGPTVSEFTEFIGDDIYVQPRDIVATLDLDDGNEDAMDDDWEAEEPGADVTRDSVEETGIQQQYLRAVHDRLKLELSGKLPALQSKWLLGHLKISD